MTVGELKEFIRDLPDDAPVVVNDAGGVPSDDCVSAEYVMYDNAFGRYLANRDPKTVCLVIVA